VEDGPYSSAQLACTDLWGNAGGDWVGPIAGQLGQAGNLSADPDFCDPAAGDFTLAAASPCAPDQSGGCGQIGAWPVGCDWPLAAPAGREGDLLLAPGVPNPCNPATTLSYTLPAAGSVRLAIHAIDGARVATLVDGWRVAGSHAVVWRGADATGRAAPSGTYLAILDWAGQRRSRTLVLLR